jgi:hypothetical protein
LTIAGIDSTVLLAVVNCVSLAWFARTYARAVNAHIAVQERDAVS